MLRIIVQNWNILSYKLLGVKMHTSEKFILSMEPVFITESKVK